MKKLEKTYNYLSDYFREAIYTGMKDKFDLEVTSHFSILYGTEHGEINGQKLTEEQAEYLHALSHGYRLAINIVHQIWTDNRPYKYEDLKKYLDEKTVLE